MNGSPFKAKKIEHWLMLAEGEVADIAVPPTGTQKGR